MMKRYLTVLLIGFLGMFSSCSDEENLSPSMADEDRLEALLDPSNASVVAFKEKFGTYILYQFDQLKDFAYQFEEAGTWRSARLVNLEQQDMAGAMSFLESNFFNYYQDSVLERYFPLKLLLCSKVNGQTLGISTVDGRLGVYHDAVVNINSMTFAELDQASLAGFTPERRQAYIRQLHYIYLAGYVVDVRRKIFVDNVFFDPSSKLYGTKIDKTAGTPGADSYMNSGFFPPKSSEEVFYPQQIEDLMMYLENLIKMDQALHDKLLSMSVMRGKMEYVARGLRAFGVNVEKLNPLAVDFL